MALLTGRNENEGFFDTIKNAADFIKTSNSNGDDYLHGNLMIHHQRSMRLGEMQQLLPLKDYQQLDFLYSKMKTK